MALRQAVEKKVRVGATKPPRRMNSLEESYANHLEAKRLTGAIQRWDYECHKLRLGDNCWYTPDFRVIAFGGYQEWHEVKGFWRDDARAKIKMAADKYKEELFIAVTKKDGEWEVEEIKAQ